MTTISAISDGSGGYKPSYWPDDYVGADYNGTSYCFITPEDMTSPGGFFISGAVLWNILSMSSTTNCIIAGTYQPAVLLRLYGI